MDKLRLKIRVILWSILGLIVIIFVYLAVVPSGRITYQNNFKPAPLGGRGFIEKFNPAERVISGFGSLKIIADPVYFYLFTPRQFTAAKINLTYKNLDPEKYPVVELGILVDKLTGAYEFAPLQNNVIDKLLAQWAVIKDGDILFLQRTKKFASLNDFLAADVNRSEIALYNYDLARPLVIPNYAAASSTQTLPALRGAYRFYVYINNEPLNLNFAFANINDGTPVTAGVNVYDANNQGILSQNLAADGTLKIFKRGLTAGVYKVEVKADTGTITKKITTTQSRLAFINKVWLAAGAVLWSDNYKIKAENTDPATRAVVDFAGQKTAISQSYKQFNLTAIATSSLAIATSTSNESPKKMAAESVYQITIPSGGYLLESDGVFSFASAALFNPDFKKVKAGLDLNGINYIVARYQPPVIDNQSGYQNATAEFNLESAFREFNRYAFVISVPGLETAADIQGIDVAPDGQAAIAAQSPAVLDIKNIKIKLTGKSLMNKVRELWPNLFKGSRNQ